MSLLAAAGLVLLGLALLVAGGEALVRGASGLALLARVTPTVVGLTVVAAGTSMPELVVSVRAAWQDRAALAMGNVVGSNIFNLTLILGLAALVSPLRIQGNSVRFEWPVMMLVVFQLHLLARDGVVDRLEGGFLLVALVAFTVYVVWVARRNVTPAETEEWADVPRAPLARGDSRPWLRCIGGVVLGVVLLAGGAELLVRGAVELTRALGVSEAVIGLTVVAAGTSTPELVTSLVAALRGKDDVAVANVLGSNIFNVLGIVGCAATLRPLPVPAEIIARDDWWMIAVAALLFPLMRTGLRIDRREGAVLTGCFVAYVATLIAGS